MNRFISPQLLPAFEWLFATATANHAHKRVLMTAADVEIYRAQHGTLPPNLSAVSSELPFDPFDGKPLRYVTRPGGYSIYSVGENMQDDGGAVAVNSRFGDIGFHCGESPEIKGARRKR